MSINIEILNFLNIIFKFFLISLFSMLIGYNRGSRNHVAGLRTHLLVGVGAMTCMLTSIAIYKQYPTLTTDPFRLAAQVISGIGFLGAGTILKTGNYIRGLTTAASLWVVSIIGITVGSGLYMLSFITFLIVYLSLKFINKFKFFSTSKYLINSITITYEYSKSNQEKLENKIIDCGISQKKQSFLDLKNINGLTEATLKIDVYPESCDESINELLIQLVKCKFVHHISYIDELDKVSIQI